MNKPKSHFFFSTVSINMFDLGLVMPKFRPRKFVGFGYILLVLFSLLIFPHYGHARNSSDFGGFYTDTGVHFLKKYGKHYDIFSTFLRDSEEDEPVINPKLIAPNEIRSNYKVRDYNSYSDWEFTATVDRNAFSDDYDVEKGHYLMDKSLEYVSEERREAGYLRSREA